MSTRNTFHIMKEQFSTEDIARIDPRIKPFLDGWQAIQDYKGQTVTMPGTWSSEIYPYKYFEVIKQQGDPNSDEEENEIQCYLSVGWRGYDDEIIIILEIFGQDVLSGRNKVSAEILKPSGAYVKLFYKGKLVTDFTSQFWFFKTNLDKVNISDLNSFLP